MPHDPTAPEMLSSAALAEAERAMADPRLTEDTKRRIAWDLFPSLLLMARLGLTVRAREMATERDGPF
jgi:hypothetical protein